MQLSTFYEALRWIPSTVTVAISCLGRHCRRNIFYHDEDNMGTDEYANIPAEDTWTGKWNLNIIIHNKANSISICYQSSYSPL
jgi:hypothetical protein